MTTAVEIVSRALNGWPVNAVYYSQSGIWNDDDGAGPHIGGYRRDCSGFATMAAGGPTPGWNTVTFLTGGHVYLINWTSLQPGDFVGVLGEGTAGNAGHIMVVVAVDRVAATYTVMEEGGGYGPDRNTYRLGHGPDSRPFAPYRLTGLAAPAPQPVPSPAGLPVYANGTRVLSLKNPMMSGTDVAFIQRFIGSAQCGVADGWFGPNTDRGVRWYQGMRGITVDGIVGPQTWHQMGF